MNGVTNGAFWRRRGLSLLAAAGVVVAVLTPAWAGDLDDQIQDGKQELEETEDDLSDVEEDLAHSTDELNDATEAYENAVAKLPAAEDELAAAEATLAEADDALDVAEGELAAARAADAEAADKLAQAEQRVEDQLAKIDEVNGRIDGKRASISRVASQAYQRGTGGELATLAAALQASDLHELVTNVEATRSVVNAETFILSDLRDDRAELANERVVLQDLEAEAQELREQAAERLAETERLERQARAAKDEAERAASQAADAKAQVEALIDDRESAKAAAQAAKKENERQYRKLENERDSIQADIDRLQREREKRERERREREREREQEENDDPPSNDGGGNGGGNDGGNGGGNDDGGGGNDGGGGGDSSSGLRWPVSNPYVTSPYGMRTHPITGVRKLHDGTDFRAYCGTPIRAAASGTVEWAYYRGGYGNQVAVGHGSMVTTYSHLSSFAVSSGSHVSQGQVVGYSGTTGLSTACHLHFMLYVNGALQNPMNYLG